MYPIYLRMADGEVQEGIQSGAPQLVRIEVEPGDEAFRKLMRNKTVVKAEIDGLGRSIFTVKAKG